MASENQNSKNDGSVSGRELSFYEVDASTIDDAARKLLVNYANIAPRDVESHVDAVVSILCELGFVAGGNCLLTTNSEKKGVQCIPVSMYWDVSIS
jgi:hypothetical protein